MYFERSIQGVTDYSLRFIVHVIWTNIYYALCFLWVVWTYIFCFVLTLVFIEIIQDYSPGSSTTSIQSLLGLCGALVEELTIDQLLPPQDVSIHAHMYLWVFMYNCVCVCVSFILFLLIACLPTVSSALFSCICIAAKSRAAWLAWRWSRRAHRGGAIYNSKNTLYVYV